MVAQRRAAGGHWTGQALECGSRHQMTLDRAQSSSSASKSSSLFLFSPCTTYSQRTRAVSNCYRSNSSPLFNGTKDREAGLSFFLTRARPRSDVSLAAVSTLATSVPTNFMTARSRAPTSGNPRFSVARPPPPPLFLSHQSRAAKRAKHPQARLQPTASTADISASKCCVHPLLKSLQSGSSIMRAATSNTMEDFNEAPGLAGSDP